MENRDRNKIFADFIENNPSFAAGKHRQLADWHYDTKLRDAVDKGEMRFADALIAARDHALDLLPATREKSQHLSSRDIAIRDIAISRNQEPPMPSGQAEYRSGAVARLCLQRAGLEVEDD